MIRPVLSDEARNLEGFSDFFVGRSREMEMLGAAVERASQGLSTVVLVSGEPGSGKTRLIEELTACLDPDSVRAAAGWCYSWEGAPSFWPWIQVVRSLASSASDCELREWLGIGAADIAAIVPELHARLPEIPELPSLDASQQRFRLLDSITHFLRQCATGKVLVICIDDLHWADVATLQLLEFAARELSGSRLVLIGSYRHTEVANRGDLQRTITELVKLRHHQRVRLIGLSRDEVRQYLIQTFHNLPDDRLVDSLHARTVGNPFFVREVAWLLQQSGETLDAIDGDAPAIPVPGTIREVVRERLGGLSEICRDVLTAAAVSGYRFSVAVLEILLDEDPAAIAEAIEESRRAGLISPTSERDEYRFVHILIQNGIRDGLPQHTLARLHLETAKALEVLQQNNPDLWLEELAHHYQYAVPLGFAEKAIEYTRRAGQRALERGAWESAIVAFERALDLLEGQHDARHRDQLELTLMLGEARTLASDADAQQTFLQAARLARQIGDAESFAAAALGYAGLNMAPNQVPREQIALLEEALDFLESDGDTLRVRLLGRLAIDVVGTDFDRERARKLTDEAIAIARRLEDPYLITWALNTKNRAFTGPDVDRQALEETGEALRVANLLGDAQLRAMSYMVRIKTLFQLQQFTPMNRAIGEFSELAQDLRVPYYTAIDRSYRAMQQIVAGEFDGAFSTIAGYRDMFSGVEFFANYQLTTACHDAGWDELAEGLALAEWYDQNKAELADYGLWLLLLCDIGELDEARRIFRMLAGRSFELTGREWMHWMIAMPMLASVCWNLGEHDSAQELYDRILPFAHFNTGSSAMFTGFGSAELHLGLLAMLLGRSDDAVGHLRRALNANEAMGWIPYVARSHLALADAYIQRGLSGDRASAQSHLEQGRLLACQLGMRPLLASAEGIMARLSHPDGLRDGHGLTPRQIEVLALIAQGMSDREIAQELAISHHTVMRHVHNILNKLSVDSRTAAASFGVRAGII